MNGRETESATAARSDSAATYEGLLDRIRTRQSTVGVIGLGYVGLPAAHAMHEAGFRVIGFDNDPKKIEMLHQGKCYLRHLGDAMTRTLQRSDRFTSTTDLSGLTAVDAILVCVPTPLGMHKEPDLQYVVSCGRAIGETLRPGQLAVLESTTYPGTTRGEFREAIESAASARGVSLTAGEDYFLAFSPEREDPGNIEHTTRTIPKVVGGVDDRSTELAATLYEGGFEKVVRVSSADVAEATKLLENIFRAVNIAMVNEMKVILTELGVDVWEVIKAASTKPFGFMPFYPGPGLGGHCIPIDPFYLTWKARETGRLTRFIELAGEINTSMPDYVVQRLMMALNDRSKSLRGSKVLVIGLAYKPDIDDTRESPSFELIERLRDLGATVAYHDPHVPVAPPVRRHDLGLRSVELAPEAVSGYDAVLISTAHRAVDYAMLASSAALVVDTRDVMRSYRAKMGERLVLA